MDHQEKKWRVPEKFDFLIVGSGTAGCTEAYLLAQMGFSVGVFEAGPNLNENPVVYTPQLSGTITTPGQENQFLCTTGSSTDQNYGGRSFPLIGGRLLGGGSSVNGMQFVTGPHQFYRQWQALASHDPAWGPESAREVFRQLETFYGVPGFFDPAVHGTQGQLSVRQASKDLALAQKLTQAVRQLGFPVVRDYNAPGGEVGAFLLWQLTQRPLQQQSGLRESSSNAFLSDKDLQQVSPNVYTAFGGKAFLFLRANVTRVHLRAREGKKGHSGFSQAKGLSVIIDGVESYFRCNLEVIVAAGINSAPLLLRSGIGPFDELAKVGVQSVLPNSHVGRHGLNHPLIFLAILPSPSSSTESSSSSSNKVSQGESGSIDQSAIFSGGCFLPRPGEVDDPKLRAFQILSTGTLEANPSLGGVILDADSEMVIQIQSGDPFQAPKYDFNYLTTSHDQQQAFELYSYMWQIASRMGLPIDLARCPDPSVPQNREAIFTYIRTTYAQAYHYTGWLRMGNHPGNSVVNHDCLVWGTSNLRVIDINVCPLNPLGNTQTTAYFVAFVNAHKIRQRYLPSSN